MYKSYKVFIDIDKKTKYFFNALYAIDGIVIEKNQCSMWNGTFCSMKKVKKTLKSDVYVEIDHGCCC